MEACEIVQQIGRDAKVSMYIECDHKMYSGGKPGRKEFMDFFFPSNFCHQNILNQKERTQIKPSYRTRWAPWWLSGKDSAC